MKNVTPEQEAIDQMDQIINEAVGGENKMNAQTEDVRPVTIDAQTGDVESSAVAVDCNTRKEANDIVDIADSMGLDTEIKKTTAANGGCIFTVVVVEATDRQLDTLARKCNIRQWSSNVIGAANKVTNFMTDVADFALNGALAPSAVAVTRAAGRTAAVAGRAGIVIAAGVATTVIQNGREVYKELSHDPTIQECGLELKGLWGDVSGKLFGSTGSSSSKFRRV